MRIFVCLTLTAAQRARLDQSLPGDEILYHPDADLSPAAPGVFETSDVAFGNPPAAWLSRGGKTQWVQLESVGFGEYVSAGLTAGGSFPRMTNLAGFFAEPVAESIMAGIFYFFRGLSALHELQRKREWLGEALRPSLRMIKDASVVLIGRGHINSRVTELLAPFGCDVRSFGSDLNRSLLDQSLHTADIIVCCVPHTAQSRGLFSTERFALLKRDAIFLNFGRGSLVDETALAAALTAGRLGAAVIDVTQEEPLPTDHPFWTTPNLLLTQHTAGGSRDEVDRKIDFFLANHARYRNGETLLSPIDFKRGY